jgi:hypothetical protein
VRLPNDLANADLEHPITGLQIGSTPKLSDHSLPMKRLVLRLAEETRLRSLI